ncbi:hypothetical protein [Cetobacterium somerae]
MKKFLIAMFTLAIHSLSYSYINISPTSLDKNIGVGAYEEFTLYNNTQIPIRYKITPIEMKESGVGNMSQWMEIYPKIVTIKPLEEASFKLYVKSPPKSKNGDYGAFLNIKQISAPKLKSDEKEFISSGLTVMTNLNMGLYGYIGAEIPTIIPENVNIYKKENKYYLKIELNNKTDRLVRVILEIEDEKKGIYPLGEFRALKGQTLDVNQEIKHLKNKKEAKKLIIRDKETNKILKNISLK